MQRDLAFYTSSGSLTWPSEGREIISESKNMDALNKVQNNTSLSQ